MLRRARSPPGAARPPTPRSARAAAPRPRQRARCRPPPAACASRRARSAGRRRGSRSAGRVSRRRCSPSPGSSRVASTTRSSGGSSVRKRSSRRSASAEPQLVQVVDDQHERLVERAQVGQQPLDDRLAAERRRGADPLDEPFPADRGGQPHRRPTARSAARPLRRARPRPTRPGRPGLRPTIARGPSCRCPPARTRAARRLDHRRTAHRTGRCGKRAGARPVSDRRWRCARATHPSCACSGSDTTERRAARLGSAAATVITRRSDVGSRSRRRGCRRDDHNLHTERPDRQTCPLTTTRRTRRRR